MITFDVCKYFGHFNPCLAKIKNTNTKFLIGCEVNYETDNDLNLPLV